MQQISNFFSELFSGGDWRPRWETGHWSEFLGWLCIGSDLLIWAAFFTIPAIILVFALRKKNLKFYRAYLWFAAFILLCGGVHLVDAVIFWHPVYRLSVLLKFMTAIISWITVYQLVRLLPRALNLKTSSEFEAEITKSRELLEELRSSGQELKKQKDFADKVIGASIDYILVYDRDLNILLMNKKTEEFLGKSVGELIGQNFLKVFPQSRDTDYHYNVMLAVAGQFIPHIISLSPSGRYYDTSFIPLEEGGRPYAALVVAREITENIEREKSLQNLNQTLNESNAKLLGLNKELEQFAYILSHDLQEPLRKIQIFSKMLMDKNQQGIHDDNISYLSKIDGSAGRMKTLIEDVLNYSRTHASPDGMKPVKLSNLLEEAWSDLEIPATEKNAVLDAGELPVVTGIPHQLQQAFFNLLHNSLKYSDQRPHIRVNAEMDKDAVGRNIVRIHFSDNGIGFDNHYREDIFSIFKRLQNRHDYPGTGIGLALVKKIAENHGGTVTATSEPGKGSVFTLTLPEKQE